VSTKHTPHKIRNFVPARKSLNISDPENRTQDVQTQSSR
jgi:hypothetical protein